MKIISVLSLAIFSFSAISEASIAPGLWSTGCVNGLKKEQTYNAKQVLTAEHFYQDAACQDESFLFETNGRVNYPADDPGFVDFVYVEIQLTLFKKAVVDDFNQRRVCGLSDWQLAVPQLITAKKCALFNYSKETQIPAAGDLRFGLYAIEENRLYYGQLSPAYDSSTPAKRPKTLNRTTEYIFQRSL